MSYHRYRKDGIAVVSLESGERANTLASRLGPVSHNLRGDIFQRSFELISGRDWNCLYRDFEECLVPTTETSGSKLSLPLS